MVDERNRYGLELILDLKSCDISKFNRRAIKSYCTRLCNLLGMKPEDLYFWDDFHVPKKKKQTNPKTKGTTAVQFILMSSITIHTLDILKLVFVNIFSCKDFDTEEIENYTKEFFMAKECKSTVVERGIQ